jgi:hypothetical protein
MTFTAAVVSVLATSSLATNPVKWRSLAPPDKHVYTYNHFVTEFGKRSSKEAKAIFDVNLAAVHVHNAKGLSWREGVNQFTDMAPAEFAQHKGK